MVKTASIMMTEPMKNRVIGLPLVSVGKFQKDCLEVILLPMLGARMVFS